MEGIDPSQLQQMGGGDPNAAAKAAEQKAAQEEQRAGTYRTPGRCGCSRRKSQAGRRRWWAGFSEGSELRSHIPW